MAIKLVDELKAMGNFPIAHAEGINLVKTDGTEDNLQNLFDNGELGGGDSSVTLTQQEYEALSEEQKLDGLYYTYDTKRIYKNGVQYGASEPIPLTMEEYKALKEAGAIDEQQEYLIEANTEGILLEASDIGYSNAVSNLPCTTVQGAIDKVDGKIEELNDSLVDLDGKRGTIPMDATTITGDILQFALENAETWTEKIYATGAGVTNVPTFSTISDWSYSKCIITKRTSQIWVELLGWSTGTRAINVCDNNKWSGWKELATMDKVVKYPDWSNQQTISQTEIAVDQDVYIELNILSSNQIEDLKINGKDVSVSDNINGIYSIKFSGYVKKGSVVSHPNLTDKKNVRVFPLV